MHSKKRNGEIDFLKFIFSLIIVLFHTFHYDSISGIQPFIGGNNSVEFFFLVSGFLMAGSASRTHPEKTDLGIETRRFILRKAKGLFPEFAVAWIIGFIVMHLAEKSFSIGQIIRDLLTGTWELFFLRMSGLTEYRVNAVTWYISAMLLAMLILYPLLLRYKETFLNIIAPCISIFLIGYMCKAFGGLDGGTDWEGFCYRGLMRAFADLSLGCILWNIYQAMRKHRYTPLARTAFSVVEFLGYGFCIYWMFGHKNSKMSFVLLMIFAVCLPVSFSHASITAPLFDNKLCYILGKISFSLYIGHVYWIQTSESLFPGLPFEKRLPITLGCITATVFLIMFLSNLIRKITPGFMAAFRKLMIKD